MSSQTFDAETVDAIFNEHDQLKAENAKLVDVLHEVETEAVYAYHCLQQDCMTTADSSEHFFKKWWHAECELDRLKAENAKLRDELEMVGTAAYLYGQTDLADENEKLREYVNAMAIQSYKGRMFDCGYCPFHNQCYNDEPKEHQGRGCQWWLWARELGIEVGV